MVDTYCKLLKRNYIEAFILNYHRMLCKRRCWRNMESRRPAWSKYVKIRTDYDIFIRNFSVSSYFHQEGVVLSTILALWCSVIILQTIKFIYQINQLGVGIICSIHHVSCELSKWAWILNLYVYFTFLSKWLHSLYKLL